MQWLEDLPTACFAQCDFQATGETASVFLDQAWIKAAARRFLKQGYFLEDVTCLDVEEGYLVLYHFDHYDTPGRITVRVVANRATPKVPSIADVYQGAEWHERECMDFYPVVFTGNPNPARLLLADDMQEKPLAKDEKSRKPLLDLFRFTELGPCADNSPWGEALAAKLEAERAAAEAAAEAAAAEAAAAEEAAAAAAEAGEGEEAAKAE